MDVISTSRFYRVWQVSFPYWQISGTLERRYLKYMKGSLYCAGVLHMSASQSAPHPSLNSFATLTPARHSLHICLSNIPSQCMDSDNSRTSWLRSCYRETGRNLCRRSDRRCFDCVDATLKSAGVREGVAAAHKMVSYLIDTRYEPVMMDLWRKRLPDHRPTWTCVEQDARLAIIRTSCMQISLPSDEMSNHCK